jgi:hypothetical protein
MKKFAVICCIALFGLVVQSYATNEKEVNQKVMQSFKNTFPLAENVQWLEAADNYTVHFELNGIRSVVDYDKDGNYIKSVRYYLENNLPIKILYKIRKKYADKNIFGVTEICTENSTDYFIKLSDDKYWITVKLSDGGQMEIVEKYKKQE